MISFEIDGSADDADKVCGALRLIRHATSLGGVESTIERRAKLAGQTHLPPTLLRLAVGIEDVDDLAGRSRRGARTMIRLTAMDELFVHQIPEPLPNVATFHEHWRESLFFILHPRDGLGDVVILTLAHFPARQEMDSLQLGRIGGTPTIAHHVRPYDGDPHTMAVGPVRIDIAEPFRTVHLHVDDVAEAPVALDLTFHARTAAYGLRRGTMRAGHELIWDQSHMVQSGTFTGTFTHDGTTYEVDDWWGQRDHSWGIRNHARVPMWMWLAVQLPDGMAALWHWEYANGARVYTDGCFAPADGSDPIAVVDVKHDLRWIDARR